MISIQAARNRRKFFRGPSKFNKRIRIHISQPLEPAC